MPLSMEDINDALILGEAKYREILREVEQEFMSATVKKQAKMAWKMIPGSVKTIYKQRDPKGYEEADKYLGGA
jgi:hypothetical protein